MLAVWPGLGILLTVLCCNFLGEWLRDALDPHRGSRRFDFQ
jgi:ABC-type dipeptide/oligopeptide/nickel transport system permease subunit